MTKAEEPMEKARELVKQITVGVLAGTVNPGNFEWKLQDAFTEYGRVVQEAVADMVFNQWRDDSKEIADAIREMPLP